MKKTISLILVLALLVSLTSVAFASEIGDSINGDKVSGQITNAPDLSGQYYSEIFGDDSEYQITDVKPTENSAGFSVSYISKTDTTIFFSVMDDDSKEIVSQVTIPAAAGNSTVLVEIDPSTLPEFYQIDAALEAGGETYTYYKNTHLYQDYLNLTKSDVAFAGKVILDYGTASDGTENFAVVSEDVKVVYVDSLEDVAVAGDSEEHAALFNVTGGSANSTFIFENAEEQNVVRDLESGDKLLILPRDNTNDATTLIVGSVDENSALFSEDREGSVAVTAAAEEPELEEFFDFLRIHAEAEADASDIDTSNADPDIVFEKDEEESADLFKWLLYDKSASKTFTAINKNVKGIQIKDTFTMSAKVGFACDYYFVGIRYVEVNTRLDATNHFTVSASKSVSYSNEWYIGTIPIGSVWGVNFSVPIYISFSASLGGNFKFEATQSAWAYAVAKYDNGRCTCETSKGGSTSRSLEASAYATVMFGLKPCIEAKVSVVPLYAGLGGEVGLEISGTVSLNKFTGKLNLYFRPSFYVKWRNNYWVNKSWGPFRKQLASISYSRAVYYTLDTLKAMTDSQIQAEIKRYEEEGIAVTLESAQDIRSFAEYVNTGRPTKGIEFVLNASTTVWDVSDSAWTPIGTGTHPFEGAFDGNGYTITGLIINMEHNNVGFFGNVSGATIHDLKLTGVSVQGGGFVGGIAGSALNGSRIYDVMLSGSVNGTAEVGGLIGRLEKSAVINSGCGATVSGTEAIGGIVGQLNCNTTRGQITNCCFTGTCSASPEYPFGGVCGEVAVCADDEVAADPKNRDLSVGINDCYYLETEGLNAVGTNSGNASVKAWAVNVEQTKGTSTQSIASTGHAATAKLVDALNNWYTEFGSYRAEGDPVPTETPEENEDDYYNHWYQDTGAFPRFANNETTFPLTVYYCYEDGTEVYPSTTLYLAPSQHFDVDPKALEGYKTNVTDEGGYSGYMTPNRKADYDWSNSEEDFSGIEYRIIYTKIPTYTTKGKELDPAQPLAAGATCEIHDQSDLKGLSDYVNGGGNTVGVTFIQTDGIVLSEAIASIGNAEMPFNGTYNGDYMPIIGLRAPLFGAVNGATLQLINLTPAITGLTEDIGVLATIAIDTTCTMCNVQRDESAIEREGALASDADPHVSNCSGRVGGLFCTSTGCMIDTCSVTGTFSGTTGTVGGIAAVASNTSVKNCKVTATITAIGDVGGLFGDATDITVENSYVSGAVSGANAGGLIGTATKGTYKNCYCSGTITATSSGGAAFGTVSGELTTKNLFYLSEIASKAIGDGTAVENISSFAADGAIELREILNEWVAATTSAAYLTWTPEVASLAASTELSDESLKNALPTFGDSYQNWAMNFRISEGNLALHIDKALLGEGAVYVGVYAENGQLLQIIPIQGSGDYTFEVGAYASYAKCFALDDNSAPVCAAIISAA